jgi:hypothetical protein
MPILLGFVKMSGIGSAMNTSPFDQAIKPLINLMMGPYLKVELLVTTPTNNTVYNVPTGGFFSKSELDPATVSDETHDFLLVPVTDEEEQRIIQTCEACVISKKGYNFKDVILQGVPFRQPEETTIFHAPTLYCAQSVVLILRECMPKCDHVCHILWELHSRTVTPNSLYEAISRYCVVVIETSLKRVYLLGARNEPAASASSVQDSARLKPDAEEKPRKLTAPFPPWDNW